jgi:hypothetical protein
MREAGSWDGSVIRSDPSARLVPVQARVNKFRILPKFVEIQRIRAGPNSKIAKILFIVPKFQKKIKNQQKNM